MRLKKAIIQTLIMLITAKRKQWTLTETSTPDFQRIKKLLPHANYPISHGLQLHGPFVEHSTTN